MTDNALANPASDLDRGLTLKELVQRLLGHWLLIGSIWAAVMIAVLAWTFLAPERFQSTAVVRIMEDPTELGLTQQLSDLPGAGLLGLDQEDVETEIGILKSWRITEAVVDSLALAVVLKKPAGIREELLQVMFTGEVDRETKVTLRRQGNGSYVPELKEKGSPSESIPPVEPGGILKHAGYRIRLAAELEDPPGTIRLELLPRYEAVKELREDLNVRRQEAGSNLVEVSLTLTDRVLAAAIVNGIVNEYVAYKEQVEGSEAGYTIDELRNEVLNYSLRLAEAEERLREFQEEQRIVAPEEEATQQVRRYAEIQVQKDALEVEREALDDLLGLIRSRVSEGRQAEPDATGYRQLATFPSLITNQAIQDLLMALLDLENERAELLVLRTEDNRDVQALTQRISELETQLFRLGTDYLESLDGQLASVEQALERISVELEQFPEKEMEYLRLYRDREVLNEAYVMLQGQLRMTQVQEAVRDEGVRIVDVGVVAHRDDPEYPKPLVNLFLGFALGLALGMGVAVLRDLWDAA